MTKPNINLIIGENIRVARVTRKVTQNDLAWGVGISQPHLSKIESGKASITAEQLYWVAKTFKQPMEIFVREQ